jgi:hypothetical protein
MGLTTISISYINFWNFQKLSYPKKKKNPLTYIFLLMLTYAHGTRVPNQIIRFTKSSTSSKILKWCFIRGKKLVKIIICFGNCILFSSKFWTYYIYLLVIYIYYGHIMILLLEIQEIHWFGNFHFLYSLYNHVCV